MSELEPDTFRRKPTSARPADDDDLQGGLIALATLATGQLSLEDTLTQVAGFAVNTIPGADGAGLTMLEVGRADTIVATAGFVTEVDAIQYSLGEGPCITAAASGHTVRSPSLGGDGRWPKFGARVARLGVHSALSLPLITGEGVLGAMNIYAHAKNAFNDQAVEIGELFAVPAAIAVQNAQVLAQTRRLAEQLVAALSDRAVRDRAVGIMMSRAGGTAEQALNRMRTMSQVEHRKVSVIAQSIIDNAVRHAEVRHEHRR